MTFFVMTVDADTGEVTYTGSVEADTIEEALQRAAELGRDRNRGRPVRVTHINEITEPANSWFLGELWRCAA